MKLLKFLLIIGLTCSISFAESASEKKAAINKENIKTLGMLYKAYPSAKAKIAKSYGYATFSNVGVNMFFVSVAGGSGVAVNQRTGKKIYMKMASGGVGIGLGVKDFRAIFLFDNKKVFYDFIEKGWEANAQADVAAKSGEKGGSVEGAVTVQKGVKLYKLTKNGLALQATIQGTKYWKDSDLN